MDKDREGQGPVRSSFGGTTGEFGTRRSEDLGTRAGFDETDDLGTRRVDTFGTRTAEGESRSAIGRSEDLGSRSGFSDSADVGTRTGFGGSAEDAGTRAGSFDRKFTETPGESGTEERSRMQNAVASGKNRIADQLHRVGERIEERARHMDESGGIQRRAGKVVHRASDALDSSASYLREHEIDEMRDDLENAIRDRPLLSVGIALGAGFLLARILRD